MTGKTLVRLAINMALVAFAVPATGAEDPLARDIESYREARAKAMVAENVRFERILLDRRRTAISSKNEELKNRIDLTLKQLSNETKKLRVAGDLLALMPTTKEELKARITGSSWKMGGNIFVFQADGALVCVKPGVKWDVKGPREVVITWGEGSHNTSIFSEDMETLQETGGMRNTFTLYRPD